MYSSYSCTCSTWKRTRSCQHVDRLVREDNLKLKQSPPCEKMIQLLREVNEAKGSLLIAAQEKLDPHAAECEQCKKWVSALSNWLKNNRAGE